MTASDKSKEELKQAVKAALVEIDDDRRHVKVHQRIYAKLATQTPDSKVSAAQCGLCGKIFKYRNLTQVFL